MKQREIILVPFPFSDQSGQKIRPALIVSNNSFNAAGEDIVVCAITSMIKSNQYSVLINQNDLEKGVLYEPSVVKVENIFKIQKSLIIKSIGSIKSTVLVKIVQAINALVKGSE